MIADHGPQMTGDEFGLRDGKKTALVCKDVRTSSLKKQSTAMATDAPQTSPGLPNAANHSGGSVVLSMRSAPCHSRKRSPRERDEGISSCLTLANSRATLSAERAMAALFSPEGSGNRCGSGTATGAGCGDEGDAAAGSSARSERGAHVAGTLDAKMPGARRLTAASIASWMNCASPETPAVKNRSGDPFTPVRSAGAAARLSGEVAASPEVNALARR